MTDLSSHVSTSSSVDSKSSECADLSSLTSRVQPLFERIKSQNRGNAGRSCRADSLDHKPAPSEEQLKPFADLSALDYLGRIASNAAGVRRSFWRDYWASTDQERKDKVNTAFVKSMLHLLSNLDPGLSASLHRRRQGKLGKASRRRRRVRPGCHGASVRGISNHVLDCPDQANRRRHHRSGSMGLGLDREYRDNRHRLIIYESSAISRSGWELCWPLQCAFRRIIPFSLQSCICIRTLT